MRINFIEDYIVVNNNNHETFKITKEHIYGTLIDNYFVYDITDANIEYFMREYTTLEDALKDCEKGYIKVF